MTHSVHFRARASARATTLLAATATAASVLAVIVAALACCSPRRRAPAPTPCRARAGYGARGTPTASGSPSTPSCPELVARNVGGGFSTAPGVGGGWRFDAPAGTAITSASTCTGSLHGLNGWQATRLHRRRRRPRARSAAPARAAPERARAFSGTYPAFSARRRRHARALRLQRRLLQRGPKRPDLHPRRQRHAHRPEPAGRRARRRHACSPAAGRAAAADRSSSTPTTTSASLRPARSSTASQRGRCRGRATSARRCRARTARRSLEVPLAGWRTVRTRSVRRRSTRPGNVGASAGATVYVDRRRRSQPLGSAVDGGAGFARDERV